MALLFVAGLVIDGGMTLAAKREMIDQAQAAVRKLLIGGAYRTSGVVTLDSVHASAAANGNLKCVPIEHSRLIIRSQ